MGASSLISPCISCKTRNEPRCAIRCPRLSSYAEAIGNPCAACRGYYPGCSDEGGCTDRRYATYINNALSVGFNQEMTDAELEELQNILKQGGAQWKNSESVWC